MEKVNITFDITGKLKKVVKGNLKLDNWFTITEIDKSTFAFQENNHWLRTNCYLLNGKKTSALIDTGMGVGNIKAAVKNLTGLPVIVISTHSHWDHIGGHKFFNEIMLHKNEVDWLSSGKIVSLQFIKNFLKTALLKPGSLPEDFNINAYKVFTGSPSRVLYGEEIIDLGDRELKIIHTPGHSPGHVSVLDIKNHYLFCGDLVYNAPIRVHYTGSDPLEYYDSICKLNDLPDILKIFPGHYNIDITPAMLGKVKEALEILKEDNLLYKGSGRHSVGDVSFEF